MPSMSKRGIIAKRQVITINLYANDSNAELSPVLTVGKNMRGDKGQALHARARSVLPARFAYHPQ